MKQIFILAVLSLVLLSSCTKKGDETCTIKEINGIKNFYNSNTPSKPNLKLTTEKLYSLNGTNEDSTKAFSLAFTMCFDKDENLYVLDGKASSIKKFDVQGKFITSFCKKGNGPGEVPFTSAFAIIQDTVMVMAPQSKEILRFDLNGKFINKVSNGGQIQFIKSLSDKAVGFKSDFDREKKGVSFNLTLFDKKFNNLKNLISNFIPLSDLQKGDIDITKLIPIFTASKSNIYIASNDKNKYMLDVYDTTGKIAYKINKKYRKIKLSKKEIKNFGEKMKRINQGNQSPKITAKYKNAIIEMLTDKNNNLWVKKAVDSKTVKDDNLYFDIFKDGVYSNTVSIDFIKRTGLIDFGNVLFINNDKIYHYNTEKNIINVYKYSLK